MDEVEEVPDRRPIPQYDINRDDDYEPDTFEYDKALKRKRDPENTRQYSCFICDNGKVWEENLRPKAYAPIGPLTIKKLNENATEYLRNGTLDGNGFRLLAELFNHSVVDTQNSIQTQRNLDTSDCILFQNTQNTDQNAIVPYKRIGEEEMERHYTRCIDSPIIQIYAIQRKYKKVAHEMHEGEMLVYSHKTKKDSKGQPVKKINSVALRDAMAVDRFIIYSTQVFDKLIKNTAGDIYHQKPI